MVDLSDVGADELRAELRRVDGRTPALRLVAGLNYKHGLTQTEIAEQYGVSRKTVYNWLTRLEERPIADAVRDDDRPGRPPRLRPGQRARFESLLRRPPERLGYRGSTWDATLAQRLLDDAFGVDYSRAHVRRLLRDLDTS